MAAGVCAGQGARWPASGVEGEVGQEHFSNDRQARIRTRSRVIESWEDNRQEVERGSGFMAGSVPWVLDSRGDASVDRKWGSAAPNWVEGERAARQVNLVHPPTRPAGREPGWVCQTPQRMDRGEALQCVSWNLKEVQGGSSSAARFPL
jgi:hypothetical protein